jgi:hypothetical protein
VKSSLIFLHIPKTGGTSLTQSLRAYFSDECCFTDNGSISASLLRRTTPALEGSCLFHGHPDHDILRLCGAARTTTILRRPEDHAISNYLYCQRAIEVPLHRTALEQDFPHFLRIYWQCLVFQAISLDVAQSSHPISSREDFFQRLPRIHMLLDRIDFVGCLDRVDDLLQTVAAAYGWAAPSPVPRLNTAAQYGVDEARIMDMRVQYQALRADPDVAPLIAAEEAIYAQACRIADRRRAAVSGEQLADRTRRQSRVVLLMRQMIRTR